MYPRYVARLFRRNGGRRWVALRSLLLLMNLAPRAPGSEHILRICPHFSAVIRGKSRRYMHRSRRGGNAGQWSWLTDLVDGIELYVSYIFRELSIRPIYRRHVASRRGQITRPPPTSWYKSLHQRHRTSHSMPWFFFANPALIQFARSSNTLTLPNGPCLPSKMTLRSLPQSNSQSNLYLSTSSWTVFSV
jgi:hypothetical protein